MLQITYFVHSSTTDNEKGIGTGWFDGQLSNRGKLQAGELGKLHKASEFACVYTSDLQRAIDTMKLAFGTRFPWRKDERLREINYGDFNGEPHVFTEALSSWIDVRFPNGESCLDVERRVSGFLAAAAERYDGQHVAVVGHQATQLAFEVILRGRTWEQAIAEDWRSLKAWKPGWDYTFKADNSFVGC